MADPQLCERCGRCCYSKIVIDGDVVYTPFPCPHLDEATRLCTIYERRHELNAQCLTVEVGIRLRVFPADCPYVRDIPDYVAPRPLSREERRLIGPEILEAQEIPRRASQRGSSSCPGPAKPSGGHRAKHRKATRHAR